MVKKIFILLFTFLLFSISPHYANLDLENPDTISTLDIKKEIQALAEEYPSLVQTEIIGYSAYGQPIYVLRLSNDIHKTPLDQSYNENKSHSLFLAGLHAKEVIAPVAFLEIIRDNLKHITAGDEQLKMVFDNQVIHFIPLANPDGFQLAKFSDKHDLFGENFNRSFKANARGVDLNRNFPDLYFNTITNQWSTIKETAHKLSPDLENVPSLSNFPGDSIESETQCIISYMDRFYFEYYIDIHSRGNYIYWDHWYLSESYRNHNKSFANVLSKASKSTRYNGYTLEPVSPYDEEHAYGYSTAYFANRFSNPALTLEVSLQKYLPHTHTEDYVEVIDRFKDIFIELSSYEDYKFPHRVYHTSGIFGDYHSKELAKAIAEKVNGYYIYDNKSIKKPERVFLTTKNYNIIVKIIKKSELQLIEDSSFITYEHLNNLGFTFEKTGFITIYEFIDVVLPVLRNKGVENL